MARIKIARFNAGRNFIGYVYMNADTRNGRRFYIEWAMGETEEYSRLAPALFDFALATGRAVDSIEFDADYRSFVEKQEAEITEELERQSACA